MKPIIIEISKDSEGRTWVTMPRAEFYEAIEKAYDSGCADGAAQKEKEFKDAGVELLAQGELLNVNIS